METGILHLHSLLRYLIIIVAIWSLIKLFGARNARKQVSKSEKTPAMLFMIMMDVQFLLGIILFVIQKYTAKIGVGLSGWTKVDRFFIMEHIPLMIIALVLIHIGYSALKKPQLSDHKKYSKAITMFIISLIVILAAVPWPFRDLGKGWMPGM